MQIVNIHEAKTLFFRLVEAASAGEEIIIARAGRPVAKLVPIGDKRPQGILFGLMKGEIEIAGDFDDLLPDDMQRDRR